VLICCFTLALAVAVLSGRQQGHGPEAGLDPEGAAGDVLAIHRGWAGFASITASGVICDAYGRRFSQPPQAMALLKLASGEKDRSGRHSDLGLRILGKKAEPRAGG
jgi:hypothetical protein